MKLPPIRPGLAALGLALLLVGALAAACAPTPSETPAPAAATAAPSEPAAAATASQNGGSRADIAFGSQDAGPSLAKNPAAASTRHYKGNPDAPVVVIEISDFQ